MINKEIRCGDCLIKALRGLDVYKHITNDEFRLRTKEFRLDYATTIIENEVLYRCVDCRVYFYRGKGRLYKHNDYEYIRSIIISDFYDSPVSK